MNYCFSLNLGHGLLPLLCYINKYNNTYVCMHDNYYTVSCYKILAVDNFGILIFKICWQKTLADCIYIEGNGGKATILTDKGLADSPSTAKSIKVFYRQSFVLFIQH